MAEPTQFAFELRELAEALVKKQGITEGVWMLGFEFGMVAGNVGLSATEIRPAAILHVVKATLVRQKDDAELKTPFVVDAAKLSTSDAT